MRRGSGGEVTVSAHDVERAIRSQMHPSGRAQIQKLLYYCQAWHATFTGEPLFSETVEAWDKGPVVADHWRSIQHDMELPAPRELDPTAEGVVAFVVRTYGRYTGKQLIDRTHKERPWLEAYDEDWQNQEITLDSMREYFSALGKRGEVSQWLQQYRKNDPDANVAPPTPTQPAPDDLAELRRLRASLAQR